MVSVSYHDILYLRIFSYYVITSMKTIIETVTK